MNNQNPEHGQEQLALQDLLLDSIPIQAWSLSDSATYGRVNQYHADFMGRPRRELEFKSLSDFLPAEVAAVCEASNRTVVETGKTVVTRELLANAAGSQRLLEITKTPTFDGQGGLRHIVCFAIDITDRDTAETTLAQSEANFRALIETIGDIIVIGDQRGRLLYANRATTAILGYSQAELCDMGILDLHAEFARDEAVVILGDMMSGKRATCPLPLQSRTGTIVPVETRIWHGRWNDSDCIFGISKDLSNEQEALQKFDRLFRMNPALMAVSTVPGNTFIDINDAFERVLGYSLAEVRGKSSRDLDLFVDAEEQGRAARMLADHGQFRELDLRVRTRDGRILDGLFSGDIIESQGVIYSLTVMIDITGRKQAEAAQQETIRELRSALSEISALQGILPICSGCKKIRDDSGYWEQVEAYVSRHTGAQFSHGLCPGCLTKLYPEYGKDGSVPPQ
jgi:PAS domain S-box-containing protein